MATEKRLIDANELLEKHTCDVYGAYDDSCMVQAVFVPYIKGAPTVNAVEVVHGYWLYHSTTMQECSNCQRHTARHKFKYCPHCGAIMEDRWYE